MCVKKNCPAKCLVLCKPNVSCKELSELRLRGPIFLPILHLPLWVDRYGGDGDGGNNQSRRYYRDNCYRCGLLRRKSQYMQAPCVEQTSCGIDSHRRRRLGRHAAKSAPNLGSLPIKNAETEREQTAHDKRLHPAPITRDGGRPEQWEKGVLEVKGQRQRPAAAHVKERGAIGQQCEPADDGSEDEGTRPVPQQAYAERPARHTGVIEIFRILG